mgnify:CR=1 FL=1
MTGADHRLGRFSERWLVAPRVEAKLRTQKCTPLLGRLQARALRASAAGMFRVQSPVRLTWNRRNSSAGLPWRLLVFRQEDFHAAASCRHFRHLFRRLGLPRAFQRARRAHGGARGARLALRFTGKSRDKVALRRLKALAGPEAAATVRQAEATVGMLRTEGMTEEIPGEVVWVYAG